MLSQGRAGRIPLSGPGSIRAAGLNGLVLGKRACRCRQANECLRNPVVKGQGRCMAAVVQRLGFPPPGGGASTGGGLSLSCDNNGVPKFSMTADSTAKAGQPFTKTYCWCDSDGEITEVWSKVPLQGRSTTVKFTAAELGISGPSGNQQNKYAWPTGPAGDVFMDFWLKDAKGQVSNTVSLKLTVNAKEISQFKVPPSFGVGFIEKVLGKIK